MTYYITEKNLAELLKTATNVGAKKVLSELGLKKSEISQREAFARFGRSNIRRWHKNAQIVPVKRGKTLWYDSTLLEILMSASIICNEPSPEYKATPGHQPKQ